MSQGNICDVGTQVVGDFPCAHKKICWMVRKAEEFMKTLYNTGPKLAIVSCKFYQMDASEEPEKPGD